MAIKEKNGESITVIDVKQTFKITKIYAWTLLENLEGDRLIKKAEKVIRGGVEYHSYLTTIIAQKDLKTLSLRLNGHTTYCQHTNSSKCQYSNELSMKISQRRVNIVDHGIE